MQWQIRPALLTYNWRSLTPARPRQRTPACLPRRAEQIDQQGSVAEKYKKYPRSLFSSRRGNHCCPLSQQLSPERACPMPSVPSPSHQLFSTVLLSHQGPLRTQIPWMLHKTQASPLKEDNLILVNSFTCHIEFQEFLQAVPLYVECRHLSKSDKDSTGQLKSANRT